MSQPSDFNSKLNPHNDRDFHTRPGASHDLPAEVFLSEEDQRLLDALVEAEFDPSQVNDLNLQPHQQRIQAIAGLLGLMKDYPVEDADETLHHATLARIDRHERVQSERLNFKNRLDSEVQTPGRRRIRLPDFMTVAAVLLIAVSVLWPVLNTARQRSMDLACANNLSQMAYAFGNYAADNNGALPVAAAGFPGVGSPSGSLENWQNRRSVIDVDKLVQGRYCEAGHLDCPGHRHHGTPSYSLRWLEPGQPLNWTVGLGQRITIVVGDLNPVVDAARAGNMISPLSVSLNHNGRGQNVLSSDGSTLWLEAPVVGGGDNIWLPEEAEHGNAKGSGGANARPDLVNDVFLTH